MKLVLVSDTHEQHGKVKVPDGDVLIHAGDLTYRGSYYPTLEAVSWMKKQPHKHKLFIAGNHDYYFEKNPEESIRQLIGEGIHYLETSSVTIDGVKFWGCPYTPRFFDWAFNADRGPYIKTHYWDHIPDDTDVLITHGPPRGYLDQAAPHKKSEHLGCDDLLDAVLRVKPKVHVFGHIHGGYGYARFQETQFYNASIVDEAYKPVNKPWEVEI